MHAQAGYNDHYDASMDLDFRDVSLIYWIGSLRSLFILTLHS